MTPMAVAQPLSAYSAIKVGDWDLLYCVVFHRLDLAADQAMNSASNECLVTAADRLSSVILDCVHALENLYQALLHERIDSGRVGS